MRQWRNRFGVVPLAALVGVGVLLGSASPAVFASSIACPPIPVRVYDAAAIVVGRTLSVEEREPRPGCTVSTYRFQVDEVLKGGSLKPGDMIVEESTSLQASFRAVGACLPTVATGRRIILLAPDADCALRSTPCGQLDPASMPEVGQALRVFDSPRAHLDSASAIDVSAMLAWIQRSYFATEYPLRARDSVDVEARLSRDEAIAYVIRHAGHPTPELRQRAVQLIAAFHPPQALEPLAAALASRDNWLIRVAAEGLGQIDDPRTIDCLLRRLRELHATSGQPVEREEPAWTEEGRQYTRIVMRPDDSYDQTGDAIIMALSRFRDPRIAVELRKHVDGRHGQRAGEALAAVGADDAVDVLLAQAWSGSTGAALTLARFDDPRISAAARLRLYDDPNAVRILAERGDPHSREFMVRLIRQGHPSGACWAAAAGDRTVTPELLVALQIAPDEQRYELVRALGRVRAFETLARLDVAADEQARWALRLNFLCGLADIDERNATDGQADPIGLIRTRIQEAAARESWSAADRSAVDALLVRAAAEWETPPPAAYFTDEASVWTPPAELADMPDPRDAHAFAAFAEREATRIRRVLQSGESTDKLKVLYAVRRVLNSPDVSRARLFPLATRNADLLVPLLTDSSVQVSAVIRGIVHEEEIPLSAAQVEVWAASPDWHTVRHALTYIGRHPKPECAAVVTQVFSAGRHLFRDELFTAIAATRAEACVARLRAYVEREHIDLRRNAAVALAHFGDSTGLAVLKQEFQRLAKQPQSALRTQVAEALALLGHEPR